MPESSSPRSDSSWLSLHSIAGGAAGSATTLLLHPFDVIKTRLQVQDGHQAQALTYRGPLHAVHTIYRQEGWRAFYNGLVPAWIGSGVAWSAYFTVYEAIKSLHLGWLGGDRLPAIWHTVSAAEAGALVCLLTNPIWLIKTRLQLQTSLRPSPGLPPSLPGPTPGGPPPTSGSGSMLSASQPLHTSTLGSPAAGAAANSRPLSGSSMDPGSIRGAAQQPVQPPGPGRGAAGRLGGAGKGMAAAAGGGAAAGRQYKGFLDALVRIGKEEGLRGYYKGLGPSLVLQTTHGAIQFTVYEELKHMATRWGASPSDPNRPVTSLETSVAAALSKLAASVITYPSQVIRSRLQQRFDLGRTLRYTSTWDVVRTTWTREGVRGFYHGLGPALLRVMPQSALTLVVYEKVLVFLKDINF